MSLKILSENAYVPPALPSAFRWSTLSHVSDAFIAQFKNMWVFFKIWLHYKKKPDFPAVVQMQTVNRCNASCKMCPYGSTTATGKLLRIDEPLYERLATELANEKSFQFLVLSFQNDPLADRHIHEHAKRYKELAPKKRLEIVTNGSLLTPETAAELYPYLDKVHVSIHAWTAKTHREVMGGLSLGKVKANLDFIAQNPQWRKKTVLRFVRQQDNAHEYKMFKRYWNRRGFGVFSFEINSRLGAVDDFDSIKLKRSAWQSVKLFFLRNLQPLLIPFCPVPNTAMYIRSTGEVVFCFNDWSDDNILGSVQDASLREVFHSTPMVSLRERINSNAALTEDVCANCDLYKDGKFMSL